MQQLHFFYFKIWLQAVLQPLELRLKYQTRTDCIQLNEECESTSKIFCSSMNFFRNCPEVHQRILITWHSFRKWWSCRPAGRPTQKLLIWLKSSVKRWRQKRARSNSQFCIKAAQDDTFEISKCSIWNSIDFHFPKKLTWKVFLKIV